MAACYQYVTKGIAAETCSTISDFKLAPLKKLGGVIKVKDCLLVQLQLILKAL
jgi:hypothetical protein